MVKITPPLATVSSFLEVVTALRLHGCLPQQVFTQNEVPEELVVEIVAIRDDDQRGVLHLGVEDDLACIKTIDRLLPLPCVCHTTPIRLSPFGDEARIVSSKARLTA